MQLFKNITCFDFKRKEKSEKTKIKIQHEETYERNMRVKLRVADLPLLAVHNWKCNFAYEGFNSL